MAPELRWETRQNNLDNGTTQSDAEEVFTNETNDLMHIRFLRLEVYGEAQNSGERANVEVSKAPAYQSGGDTTFFTLALGLSNPSDIADGDEMDIFEHATWMFAQGQLTLEPNESLYTNWLKDSTVTGDYRLRIGYNF